MIGRGIVLALGLGIIAFGGSTLHCVFSEHETQCAARGARDARSRRLSDADASAKHLTWPSQCSRHEWLGMMKCQFAPLSTGCHEGRDAWYDAGCLCDYDQYLWKGATPIGYVWTMMALGKTYPEMAAESGCLEDTTLCKPPSDGDVRLSAYGKDTAGALEVYAGGDWLQAVGTLSNASATAVCGRLGACPVSCARHIAPCGLSLRAAANAQPQRTLPSHRACRRLACHHSQITHYTNFQYMEPHRHLARLS